MDDFNGKLKLHPRVTIGQFAFIDLFVKKAAQVPMNLEDASHNGVSQVGEFGLRKAANGRGENYRHDMENGLMKMFDK